MSYLAVDYKFLGFCCDRLTPTFDGKMVVEAILNPLQLSGWYNDLALCCIGIQESQPAYIFTTSDIILFCQNKI